MQVWFFVLSVCFFHQESRVYQCKIIYFSVSLSPIVHSESKQEDFKMHACYDSCGYATVKMIQTRSQSFHYVFKNYQNILLIDNFKLCNTSLKIKKLGAKLVYFLIFVWFLLRILYEWKHEFKDSLIKPLFI